MLALRAEFREISVEKSDLRPLVIEALRQEPRTQFANVANRVRNLERNYQSHDVLKVYDILWDLLIQGVLAPGMDSSNLYFPFLHVTDYGQRCLDAGMIVPHDPDRYVTRLQQQVGRPLDDIVLIYVREGLLTFLGGHYLASTVMVGVASERCIDLLTESLANAIADPNRKATFKTKVRQAGRSVKRRFDALRDELLVLHLPGDLADALDIQLSGIFTLLRYSRNDAGHPTGRLADRDEAHANLLLFPGYCKRVYDLIAHFQSTPV